MQAEIVNSPFSVSLIGKKGRSADQCWGELGRQLMDAMWPEVRRLGIANTGINHWVYLPDSHLFTGVQPTADVKDLGSLEKLHVELTQYARYVHRGPYSELHQVWPTLMRQLSDAGRAHGYPSLEIYGHWTDDPSQLTTTILIGLEGTWS